LPAMVRGKDAVVASEVDPGFWHQGGQSRHEIHRIERYLVVPSR